MAKKKSKKSNASMIISIIVIALSVLTICTLFMPVFKTIAESLLGNTDSVIKGTDVLTSAFHGEYSTDISAGANSMIALKTAEDASFVANLFIWGYVITLAVSVASLVFAVLNILGLRFKLVNTILGVALVVLALLTFIMSFVVAGKFVSLDLGILGGAKTIASIGSYLLIGAILAGGAEVYNARK